MSTSSGTLHIPQTVPSIRLNGRQSKVLVTDYSFGSSRALYSTASVLFAGKIGSRDVLFLFGDSDQQHEAAIPLNGRSGVRASNANVKFSTSSTKSNAGNTIISILSGVKGLVTLWDSDSQLVLYSDTDTAGTFFAPVIPSTSSKMSDAEEFANFWQFGTNDTVLVGGPNLVRNASISGSQLALRGDLNQSVALTVIAPSSVKTVTWNGERVEPMSHTLSSPTRTGGFVGQLNMQNSLGGVKIPQLTNWRFKDSLPEVQNGFSDAEWTIANHTTTNIPQKPFYGDGRVLYGCDYQL